MWWCSSKGVRLGYEWFEAWVFPWFGSSFFLFNRKREQPKFAELKTLLREEKPIFTDYLAFTITTFFHVLRSVWYDTERFPSSWRLDPTEGPDRIRCRLQRFHLDVDKKYVMEEYREKSEFIIVLKDGAHYCYCAHFLRMLR